MSSHPLDAVIFDWYGTLGTNSSALLPGARDLLHNLYAVRVKVGIITFAHGPAVRETLVDNGISFCVKVVVGDEIDCGSGLIMPPHPSAIMYCLGKLNMSPSRAVYVGDEQADVSAAAFVPMRSISVTYGKASEEELRCAWAKTFAHDIRGLEAQIGRMLRPHQAKLLQELH